MLNPLTKNQLDQLQQHLIVPLAISDILHHDLEVEPDMQYGLHMALSEIDPDSALLAIALCARDLAEKFLTQEPIASALQTESNNIIKEYGPTWLRHYKGNPMSSDTFELILETVPEDLEALADLMDALCADLEDQSPASTALANLLSIQARAHMEIANFVLAEMAFEKTSEGEESSGEGTLPPTNELIDMDAHMGKNIIIFPGNPNA